MTENMEYAVSPDEQLLNPVYEYIGDARVWNSWSKTATLVKHLTWRSLAARYRGSALGFVWSLVNPILLMLVYTIVFQYILRTSVPQFPVYLMTGILAWNFMSSAAINASVSLVSGAALINKSTFPRIALPLSNVCANAVNYLVALPLLLVFVLAFGVKPTPALLLFPFALLLLTMMATGVGAMLSAIMPFFLDLQHLIEVVFTMWFFLSPVVYPIAQVKTWRHVYELNPMVGIIELVHSVFLGQPLSGTSLAIAIVETLVIFVFGIWVFNRLSVHCTEV